MRILNILSNPYRATLEEQDDTIIWLSHAMTGAGASIDLLLTGQAVNYAMEDQNACGLFIGGIKQSCPPDICREIGNLINKGGEVFLEKESIELLGIEEKNILEGIKVTRQADCAELFSSYQHIWYW